MDQYTNKRKASKATGTKIAQILGGQPVAVTPKRTEENIVLLPTDGLKEYGPEGRYAAMGFKILEIDERDPMFTQVILPEGWKVTFSDHGMYKNIVDGKGRMRTRYFYKAAFYDRSASMWGPERRYQTQLGNTRHPDYYEYLIIDRTKATWNMEGMVCKEAILHSAKVEYSGEDQDRSAAHDEAERIAIAWLTENYPNHKDFMAYWD